MGAMWWVTETGPGRPLAPSLPFSLLQLFAQFNKTQGGEKRKGFPLAKRGHNSGEVRILWFRGHCCQIFRYLLESMFLVLGAWYWDAGRTPNLCHGICDNRCTNEGRSQKPREPGSHSPQLEDPVQISCWRGSEIWQGNGRLVGKYQQTCWGNTFARERQTWR